MNKAEAQKLVNDIASGDAKIMDCDPGVIIDGDKQYQTAPPAMIIEAICKVLAT